MKKEYMHLAAEANGPAEAFERLSRIIAILRKECPWDRKQTHESLKSCLIEEAYEVIEAIEKNLKSLKKNWEMSFFRWCSMPTLQKRKISLI